MDQRTNAAHYEIHIGGLLSELLLSAFPELHAGSVGGITVLVGNLPDQAALHGVLSRIESLGLELIELRRVGTRPGVPADASEAEANWHVFTSRSRP